MGLAFLVLVGAGGCWQNDILLLFRVGLGKGRLGE